MTYVIFIPFVTLSQITSKSKTSTIRPPLKEMAKYDASIILDGKEVVALVKGEGGGTELVQDTYPTFWSPCRADPSTVKY